MIRVGFVSNSSSSSFVLLSDEITDPKGKNLALRKWGNDRPELSFLNEEEREEFLKHPEDYEYEEIYSGAVRLDENFEVTQDMIGKIISIEAFGIYDMPPDTSLTLEDFKKK